MAVEANGPSRGKEPPAQNRHSERTLVGNSKELVLLAQGGTKRNGPPDLRHDLDYCCAAGHKHHVRKTAAMQSGDEARMLEKVDRVDRAKETRIVHYKLQAIRLAVHID